MAKKGVAIGSPLKAITEFQSKVKEPSPKPYCPEVSCWANTESFHIRQPIDIIDSEGKK